jgi:hypothetical protein
MRLAWLLPLTLAACPGHSAQPAPQLTVQDVLARLAKQRAERTSFVADSTMDYWAGSQRVKAEVLVMGTVEAQKYKLRLAALSPAGGSTMAEMACDGVNFVFVDYQNNCQRSGPCNGASIAQFFSIDLQPDDFVHLSLGTPPVIDGDGKLTWDGDKGVERVEIHGAAGTQRIAVRPDNFDVVSSELVGRDGKVRWSVENADFVTVAGHRLPGKTRFKSPSSQQDLLVEWGEPSNRKVNEPLPDEKFQLVAPAGLAPCGGGGGAPPAQGGRPPSGPTTQP